MVQFIQIISFVLLNAVLGLDVCSHDKNTKCCKPNINCIYCSSCMTEYEYSQSLQQIIYESNKNRRLLLTIDSIFASITIGFVSNASIADVRMSFSSYLNLPQDRLAIPVLQTQNKSTDNPYKIQIRYAKNSDAVSDYKKIITLNDNTLTELLKQDAAYFRTTIHRIDSNESDPNLLFITFVCLIFSITNCAVQYTLRFQKKSDFDLKNN